jgi:hypothetical protein
MPNFAPADPKQVASKQDVLNAITDVFSAADVSGPLVGAAPSLAQNFPRNLITTNHAVAATGIPIGMLISLSRGQVLTGAGVQVGATIKAGGTHGWLALADSTYAVLAVSADQTDAATTFHTANKVQSLPFSATYTVAADGDYYVVYCITAGTTMPTLNGATAMIASGVANADLPPVVGTFGSQPAPPALAASLGAITTTVSYMPYCFVY